jgi:hypothetical protein
VVVTCWSAKGGSGTTTVAVALACLLAAEGGHVTLVDLCGDAAAALGRPEPAGPGVTDLLASSADALAPAIQLAADVDEHGVGLVGRGSRAWAVGDADRLAEALGRLVGTVVVDAGTVTASVAEPTLGPGLALAASATQSLLVLRSCYLGLRRALALPLRPSGVVLVREPGRALGARDVEAVLGVGVTAEVPWDPAVARAMDAGLLATRLPSVLVRALRRAA